MVGLKPLKAPDRHVTETPGPSGLCTGYREHDSEGRPQRGKYVSAKAPRYRARQGTSRFSISSGTRLWDWTSGVFRQAERDSPVDSYYTWARTELLGLRRSGQVLPTSVVSDLHFRAPTFQYYCDVLGSIADCSKHPQTPPFGGAICTRRRKRCVIRGSSPLSPSACQPGSWSRHWKSPSNGTILEREEGSTSITLN